MADLNSIPTPTSSPEPAVIGTFLAACISLLSSLVLHLEADQVIALSTVVTLLAGFVIRRHVKPVVKK